MRCSDEESWVAEYWDEILHEFGIQAYLEAREEQYANYLRGIHDATELGSPAISSEFLDSEEFYRCLSLNSKRRGFG